MKYLRLSLFIAAAMCALLSQGEEHKTAPFLDKSIPSNFLELRAYALAGGSTITQNYINCFPEINELNVTMGTSVGAGVGAQFAFRDYLGLGTELNLLFNNYTTDLAVTGDNLSSVSTVFLKNHFVTLNIPLYLSMRFNLAPRLRWNIDLGMYYTYGLGGHQKQSIYDSRVNELGQMVMQVENATVKYYNSYATFMHSSRRGDLGIHIGTGLMLGRHLMLGVRTQIGLKNIAHTDGIKVPRVHNINFLMQAGYRF